MIPEPITPRPPNPTREDMDGATLLGRVAAGDPRAFEAFYARYSARIMAFVRCRVSQVALAQEIVQEVFVAAWTGAGAYRRDVASAEAWLLGIARHKIDDHWRSVARLARTLGAAIDAASAPRGPHADIKLAVERALATLTADQRRVLTLIYAYGLTFTETASALGIPAGTVKSRVHAALGTLRAALAVRMPP